MDFQRFSLKKRKSNGALKGRQTSSSHPDLPTPTISVQHTAPRAVSQRVKSQFMSTTSESYRLAAANSRAMPTSPTFDSEDETMVGEPLLQDYATRSIPKEYKPVGTTFLEDDTEDFSIQTAFPAHRTYSRSGASSPAREPKRDTAIHVPARTR
jgi:hypothetical protein